MSARPRPAGKHRRPGKHRRAAAHPAPPGPAVLIGTAVVATAAAALLTGPSQQALGDVRTASRTTAAPAPVGLAAAVATVTPTPSTSPTPRLRPSTRPTPKPRASAAASRASRGGERAGLLDAPIGPQWVRPIDLYALTAHFGEGGTLWSHGHTGQDFAAPTGTTVKAAGSGVVVSAGWAGAYGNRVILHHSDGTDTWYCHLSAENVRPGQSVDVGEQIGRVGSTGNTTGPHLHFEVRPGGGDAVDPLPWLRARGIKV